eukprot:Gb_17074 [translate_table: standard]
MGVEDCSGKRKQGEISDCWDYCLPRLKKFHASSSSSEAQNNAMDSPSDGYSLDDTVAFSVLMKEFIHQNVDVSEKEIGYCCNSSVDQSTQFYNSIQPATLQQELTQGDLDELLQNILTEETHEEMFPVPAVQSVTTETTAMADLKSFEQMGSSSQASLYSGPTLTDVKSALSQYSKQDHGSVSTLDMSTSASSTASSLLFNSLSPDDLRAHRSDSWLPTSALNMDRDIISGGTYGSFSNSINALFYKRLQKARNEPKYSLKIKSSGTTVDDGYKWRKYGQKAIKNSPHPRSYYRCTNPRCSAKKQVERSVEDPETITITYEGLHLHYSYSHIQLSQPPNYYNNNNDHRHPHVTTEEDEEQQQHKLPENGYINIDERNTDAMQALPSFNACMEDSPTHQSQQPQEEQCVLSCSDGYNWDVFGGHIGVGEECGGGLGRGDGLLQDIVPLGIINPSSSSSSSSSSFYSSP